jgi:hypothetical protein
MNGKLELTEEELQVLDFGLQQALGSTRVELHHTQGFPYKDHVKERIRLLEGIVGKIEQALKPAAGQTT